MSHKITDERVDIMLRKKLQDVIPVERSLVTVHAHHKNKRFVFDGLVPCEDHNYIYRRFRRVK